MSRHLQCERYVVDEAGVPQWDVVDWRTAVTSSTALRPTFVYIHGNRVARGMDRSQGLQVYRSLAADGKPDMPIRFIIWSWPSSHIAGPVKDYKVKAHRTGPAGWQLAWFVDQLPADSPVALWGYSYGARVASGALHLLGGGTLSGLKLDERVHPDRQPLRAAMVAAAFDADWIQPGHYHGRVLAQTDMLVLATNELDPAMRFFHLSNGRGRIHALGKQGVAQPQTLGAAARRLRPIDFTREVGRTHALTEYLSASEKMTSVWRQLMGSDTSHADNIASVRRDASHRISNVEPGMSK